MSVAIVAWLYGTDYDKYLERFFTACNAVEGISEVVLAVDHGRKMPTAAKRWRTVATRCSWNNPVAYYLDQAIRASTAEHVWPMGIDDEPHADALENFDPAADVWQMGFRRSDGFEYLPPHMSMHEVLAHNGNSLVGSSPIRRSLAIKAGVPDILACDWGLWRRLARMGASFQYADRVGFTYDWRPGDNLTSQVGAGEIADALAC